MSKRYWEWESPFDLNREDCALLIVDMQKGFVDQGACLEVPMAREQVPAIADFSRFCHEKGIPVYKSVFAQTPDFCYPFYWNKNRERGLLLDDGTWRFEPGSTECEMTAELAEQGDDTVFPKYGYDCFANTDLDAWLQDQGRRTVIICGTVVNWCVDSTVRSAYHRGYDVVVLADAVSGYDHAGLTGEQWVSAELDLFGEGFAKVLSCKEAEEELGK